MARLELFMLAPSMLLASSRHSRGRRLKSQNRTDGEPPVRSVAGPGTFRLAGRWIVSFGRRMLFDAFHSYAQRRHECHLSLQQNCRNDGVVGVVAISVFLPTHRRS
ncbi:hypothetical protein C8R46DRAFT_179739 [Mycena filopes]|nr:hypothetical protein C8R46DRAFT_179739 [Mycena filopes]